MKAIELYEMTFPRKVAEAKIRGREETINLHLVKILAFNTSDELKVSWKKELLFKHFKFIAAMRLKGNKLIPQADLFQWLYAEPFEGNEVGYLAALVDHIRVDNDYDRNTKADQEVVKEIKAFHEAMSEQLSKGNAGEDLIATL